MTTLEQEVQRLKDIEEIRLLKTRYAELCDDHYNPDGLAALFTEDAVWDGSPMGRFVGREQIREFYAGVSARIPFALHMTMCHRIEIAPSGSEASGHWYTWTPAILHGRAVFMASNHSDEYKKAGGKWLIHRVKSTIHFITPYESGWVKEPFLKP